jgi:predicted  nucleic acid-binding Zn-ribbon protein
MSRFADIRVEWRVEEIERNLQRKANQHEISTLSGDVGRLECSLREARAEVDGLRHELQALQDQVTQLLQGANHEPN